MELSIERCSGEVCPDCCVNKQLVRGIPSGADKETTCLELTTYWGRGMHFYLGAYRHYQS